MKLKFKKYLLSILLIFIGGNGFSQIQFSKEYAFDGVPVIHGVTENNKLIDQSQAGFVLGMIKIADGVRQAILTTVDEVGDYTGLFKRYSLGNDNDVLDIHIITLESGGMDDGYFMTGKANFDGESENYLIRTDNDGEELWSRRMEMIDDDGAFKDINSLMAIQLADGNILIAGSILVEEGAPDTRELFLMKVNAVNGSVFWSHQYTSPIMGDGFLVKDLMEVTPGEYYVAGGEHSYFSYIAHFTETGGSLSTDIWRYNLSGGHIRRIMKGDDGIVVVGEKSTDLFAFRVDDDLTNIRTLDNVNGMYDNYEYPNDYVFPLDILSHSGKIILSVDEQTGLYGSYLSVLSSDGAILNNQRYLTDSEYAIGSHLFDTDNSFYIGNPYDPFLGDPKNFNLTAFSLGGNTCDQEYGVVTRTQENFTATHGILESKIRAFHYDLLDVTVVDDPIPLNVICETCTLTVEDVDPITTSTGANDLCGLMSMDLIGPPGFDTYTWYLGGDEIGTGSTHNITEGGEYSLILTYGECEIELFICITPGVDVSAIDGNEYCLYMSYALPDLGGDGSWSGTGVVEFGGNYFLETDIPGDHVLTYCNSYGCCEDATITVNEVVISLIDFDGVCIDACTGYFTATVDGELYDWELFEGLTPLGTTSDETTFSFSGLCAGTYTLKARANDAPFCSGEITFTVTAGEWHKTTENTTGTEDARDVVTDVNGNVYITGTFTETTELEGGLNPNIMIGPSAPDGSMYVAKYDDCGTLLWVAHSTGTGTDLSTGNSLVLDEDKGLVYVTGNVIATPDFNNAQSEDDLCMIGGPITLDILINQGAYVAQYDMNTGCLYFVKDIDLGKVNNALTITINEDSEEIFVGGSYKATALDMNVRSFIYKFDPVTATGMAGLSNTLNDPVWTAIDASSNPDAFNQINDLDYDENRDLLYGIGTYHDEVKLLMETLSNPDPISDAFLISINDVTGTLLNLRGGNVDDTGEMTGNGVSVDKTSGAVFLTGSYNKTKPIPFFFAGIDPLPNIGSNMHSYMIGARVGGTFTPWARHTIPAPISTGWVDGMDVSNIDGNAYFLNEFSGAGLTVASGGGLGIGIPYIGDPTGNSHIGVISYSILGIRNWINVTESALPTGSDDHNAYSITTNQNGESFIAGNYNNTLSYKYGIPYSGDLIHSGLSGGYNACVLRIENNTGWLKTSQSNLDVDNNLVNEYDLILYPNPTSDLITIELNEWTENVTYCIYSMNGVLILNGILTENKYQLNLSDFSTGVYMIELKTTSQTIIKKIVLE
ncbi:MAG: hypothetical protein ACI8ZM_005528 [Crocinitomix sp.]|jgi:hypothetical protein